MPNIHDVVVKELVTRSDDRGYFREILREDDNLLRRFGQTSITKTYPGVIKAFHWHNHQDDIWYVASGMARVVLHDRR
ncbi:MAG: spore coat protein, partial [Chloroflexota bacterium]